MAKTCSTCAMYVPEQSGCVRTQKIEKPDGYCHHWVDAVPTCAYCGNKFLPPALYVMDGDNPIAMCHKCASARGTCHLCSNLGPCDFETNPIAIPPIIQKTVRQGNQVITAQVPNLERVKATCVASGCRCYHKDEDGQEYCCRNVFGTCGNYDMIVPRKDNNDEVSTIQEQ